MADPQMTITRGHAPRCVIIVENLPVPFDRRVWQEANALKAAGWQVSVICPKSEKYPRAYEEIDGIAIYRHSLPLEARGKTGFILEYTVALFHETRLLIKIALTRGFDVIQACNPPDLIFIVAAPYKLLGKKFVFDQHDAGPELFFAKYNKRGFLYRLVVYAEKCTYMLADMVIAANDTYRELAIGRGKKQPQDVTAVYSVPAKDRIKRVAPDTALRADAHVVLGYVGIIADQDGVDHLVQMMHCLVHVHARTGIRAVVVGDGPALASVKSLAQRLDLDRYVVFTGYLQGDALLAALSAFDIGVIPDPVNAYNDSISMNKVFEYSALGIPSVSYDLRETRRLLGDTCSYAKTGNPLALADACLRLIDDPDYRHAMGEKARSRTGERYSWEREAEKYVSAYERMMTKKTARWTIRDLPATLRRLVAK